MKKLLVVLTAVVVLVIAGLAVFIATFDADRYRPLVVEKLESALGRPVSIGRISLAWQGGLAFEVRQLAIYKDVKTKGNEAIQLEKVSAVVRLLPLLRKSVELGSVTLTKPRLHVVRGADGVIKTGGISLPQGKPKTGAPSAAAQAPPPLSIGLVSIRDGEIRFTDENPKSPVDIVVRDVDVTLKNVSLAKPIQFQARMALFGDRQNLDLAGRFTPPQENRPGVLEDFRLRADLGQMKASELRKAAPALQNLGLQEGLSGDLAVEIDYLSLDPAGLAALQAKSTLSGGKVILAQLRSPIEDLSLDALAKQNRMELKHLSAKFAGGTIEAAGVIDPLNSQPRTSFQAKAEGLAVEAFSPPAPASAPQLKGRVWASFQGTAAGAAGPEISQTLTGQGELHLRDAVITNFNVLREVFGRLSIIPGVVERLQSRLPENYLQKLNARDTYFQPVDLLVTAREGGLYFNNLRVAADGFQIFGAGRIGLDGTINSQAALQMDPELSFAFSESVSELQYFINPQGQLEIPVTIQGPVNHPRVVPDLRYVASRVAVTKGQELLEKLFSK